PTSSCTWSPRSRASGRTSGWGADCERRDETMRIWSVPLVATALLLAASVGAQEGRRDSTAGFGQAPPGGAPGGRPAPQTPYVMPPIGQALVADPHNKLVHFPIVLSLVAAALVLLSRKKPELEPVAFWLAWLALLSTLAAYFSGFYQSTEFEHRPKR